MPVESATYIHDLNTANPVHTDGLNATDSHLRLIKTILKNTFPSLDAPVTSTPAGLNNAGGIGATAGIVDVPQQSPTVGAEITLAQANGVGGDITILNAGTAGAAGSLSILSSDTSNANPHAIVTGDYTGNIAALASINAPSIRKAGVELLPPGVIMIWSGSSGAIPTGYYLCNGANGTPDLRGMFLVGAGGSYAVGATGGASSVTPTTVSAGTHAHSGVTQAAGGHTPSGVTDLQGDHSHSGNTQGHVLSLSELPAHDHSLGGFSIVADTFPSSNVAKANTGPGSGFSYETATSQGSGQAHVHPVATDGLHAHALAISAVPDHSHSINVDGAHTHTVTVPTLPPYYALCFIMKS